MLFSGDYISGFSDPLKVLQGLAVYTSDVVDQKGTNFSKGGKDLARRCEFEGNGFESRCQERIFAQNHQ